MSLRQWLTYREVCAKISDMDNFSKEFGSGEITDDEKRTRAEKAKAMITANLYRAETAAPAAQDMIILSSIGDAANALRGIYHARRAVDEPAAEASDAVPRHAI